MNYALLLSIFSLIIGLISGYFTVQNNKIGRAIFTGFSILFAGFFLGMFLEKQLDKPLIQENKNLVTEIKRLKDTNNDSNSNNDSSELVIENEKLAKENQKLKDLLNKNKLPDDEPPIDVKVENTEDDFQFSNISCEGSGIVDCKLTIKNLKSDRELILRSDFSDRRTRAFDEEGNEYKAIRLKLANKVSNHYVESLMIENIPVQSEARFEINSKTKKFSKIEFQFSSNKSNMWITQSFKNIPIK